MMMMMMIVDWPPRPPTRADYKLDPTLLGGGGSGGGGGGGGLVEETWPPAAQNKVVVVVVVAVGRHCVCLLNFAGRSGLLFALPAKKRRPESSLPAWLAGSQWALIVFYWPLDGRKLCAWRQDMNIRR